MKSLTSPNHPRFTSGKTSNERRLMRIMLAFYAMSEEL